MQAFDTSFALSGEILYGLKMSTDEYFLHPDSPNPHISSIFSKFEGTLGSFNSGHRACIVSIVNFKAQRSQHKP